MHAAVVIRDFQKQRLLQIHDNKVVIPAAVSSLLVGRFVQRNKCNVAFSRTLRWDSFDPIFVATQKSIAAMRQFEAPLVPIAREGPAPVKLIPTLDTSNDMWRNVGETTQTQHEMDVMRPANSRVFNVTEMCLPLTKKRTSVPEDNVPLANVSCAMRDTQVVNVILDGSGSDASNTGLAEIDRKADDSYDGRCELATSAAGATDCVKNLVMRAADEDREDRETYSMKRDTDDATFSVPPIKMSRMSIPIEIDDEDDIYDVAGKASDYAYNDAARSLESPYFGNDAMESPENRYFGNEPVASRSGYNENLNDATYDNDDKSGIVSVQNELLGQVGDGITEQPSYKSNS